MKLRNDIVADVLAHLNKVANTDYKLTYPPNVNLVNALLDYGYTEQDICTVIDKKAAEWMGTEFEMYLRPETLFGDKFQKYLHERNICGLQKLANAVEAAKSATWRLGKK